MEDEESPTKTHEAACLIAQVKKYPILFDPAHQHFKNNAVRTKVWDKIAEALGGSQDRKKVMVKWKNLKKKFIESDRLPFKNKTTQNSMRNHQVFLDAMQFIVPFNDAKKMEEYIEADNDDLKVQLTHPQISRPVEERNTLHYISEDILIEDAFIDEIKKHPELLSSENPSHRSRSTRKKVWTEIAAKFEENEKKLILKWKNLRRKYIMMRYPQSSKNSITGKRKIRYNQEFIERLSFLDKYLNQSIIGKDYKEEADLITEEEFENEPIEEQIVFLEEAPQNEVNEDYTTFDEDENNDQDQDDQDQDVYSEATQGEIIIEDQTEDYEQILYDQEEESYEEIEEPILKKQRPSHSSPAKIIYTSQPKILPSAPIVYPSFDTMDYFCLSLSEPLRRLDFLSQQRVKEKIYAVINTELEISFAKASNM